MALFRRPVKVPGSKQSQTKLEESIFSLFFLKILHFSVEYSILYSVYSTKVSLSGFVSQLCNNTISAQIFKSTSTLCTLFSKNNMNLRITLSLPRLEHTVRKFLTDVAVCDWWRYCKALYDEKFFQTEGNGRKFRHIQLNNSVIS